jgi:hypothetical protein
MGTMTFRGAAWLAWLPVVALAGCGSGGAAKTDGGAKAHDADFSVCSGTPAVPYAPGMAALSASGTYRATVQAAVTVDNAGGSTPTAGIGKATFTVAVAGAADGGVVAPTDGLTMSIPPSPSEVPADPYMPVHKHGASFSPTITPQGTGLFTVADIDFFMGGYWQLYLNLTPPGATTRDRVTFEICIPTD